MRRKVIRHLGMLLASLDRGQMADPAPHGVVLHCWGFRPVSFIRQTNWPVTTGDQHQPTTTLGHAIPRQHGRFEINIVPGSAQPVQEAAEGLAAPVELLQSRNILDEYQIRLAHFDEISETRKQRHSLIRVQVRAGRVLLGEGLAGRASAEQHWMGPLRFHVGPYLARIDLPDVGKFEMGLGKICLKRLFRVYVEVQCKGNVHTGIAEAATCPPATREEIKYVDCHCLTAAPPAEIEPQRVRAAREALHSVADAL